VAELLDQFDGWTETRDTLRRISAKTEEWAGIPMPIKGEQLTVHPSYPWAKLFNDPVPEGDFGKDCTLRNTWWSKRYRCRILIVERSDGKLEIGVTVANKIGAELRTMGCSVAWGVQQEHNALQTLAGLVKKHHHFKQYLMTGTFCETSPRSGVTYMFRKLRPTIAFTVRDEVKILCALCLHPIGYYQDSWAGAMCPTDDVVAHLMLMRADEHLYWKRCNQIQPHLPESGL